MIQYPIAIASDTGEVVHISNYSAAEHNGKMVCPNCQGIMIAKAMDSSKVVSHYAHLSLDECHGYETVLHDWAKNHFSTFIGKTIKLPSIMNVVLSAKKLTKLRRQVEMAFIEYRKTMEPEIKSLGIFVKGWTLLNYFPRPELEDWIRSEFIQFIGRSQEEVTLEHEILIETVDVEVPMGDGAAIVDVLLNGKYGIEIFVTHRVDEIKEALLKDIGLNIIEIDLSSYEREFFEVEKMTSIMLNEVQNKNVFGSFQDIRGVEFHNEAVDLERFKLQVIKKAEQLLFDEIHLLKEKNANLLVRAHEQMQKDPQTFFVEYALRKTVRYVDYRIRKQVDEMLEQYGFPLLAEDKRRLYQFPLTGTVTAVVKEEEYNRLKLNISCIVFFDAFQRSVPLDIVIAKGEYKKIKGDLVGKRFAEIKAGWHGIELIGINKQG